MNPRESMEFLGSYQLRQSEDCFKLGRDSVLLSRFVTLKKNVRVCDLGCGVGSLLLLLSLREPSLARFGLELDARAAALAQDNLDANGLSGKILCTDLRKRDVLPPDSFHLVISNPPYFKAGTGDSGGVARMDEACTVTDLCRVAARLLRSGGRFTVVFRAERLADLFTSLRAFDLEPKRMQFLSHNPQKQPYAVLVESIKGGGEGLTVLPVHYQEMPQQTTE